MLIVGISGSPRKNGNCEKILASMEEYFGADELAVETIKLSETAVEPCRHCDYCLHSPKCAHDRTANEINKLLRKADAIVVTTPVYFGSMTGQLKCLLDKTLPLRRIGFLLNGKIGAAIAIGNSRNGGQEKTISVVHSWMLIHGMVVVGDNKNFGGAVLDPLENDEIGRQTVFDTFEAVNSLLRRLKQS